MHTESVAAGFKFPCPKCKTINKVPLKSEIEISTHIPCKSIIGSDVGYKTFSQTDYNRQLSAWKGKHERSTENTWDENF
jgi:phage FluMu protein Com